MTLNPRGFLPIAFFLLSAYAPLEVLAQSSPPAPAPAQAKPSAQPAPHIPSGQAHRFGDHFYRQKKYRLAGGEYEKAMLTKRAAGRPVDLLTAKLALSLIRERRYQQSLKHLNERHPFALFYLRMYASLRVGYLGSARRDYQYARTSGSFDARQKSEIDLLGGTLFLEQGDYERAYAHYEEIQKESEDERIRKIAGGVLTSMKNFQDKPRKPPWLAGMFSAVLPGSGQWYSGHEIDGIMTFFFNAFFIGSAVALYDLERAAGRPHTASGVFGTVGLFFYVTNIVGAVASAKRYNVHQERVFQQEVRDRFFNTDYVERASGLQFRTEF